jgi:site-specific DNA-methyltransferase (adenine-specific)
LTANNYNPDVLTCIANLSSDEIFTPPQLANQILDLLPAELWSDKKTTFLGVCPRNSQLTAGFGGAD